MSADRASNLTRHLLAFSRRQVMQPREPNVNDAITHFAQMLRRILGEDVRLQLSLAGPLQQRDPSLRVLFTSGYSAELAGQSLVLEESHNFLRKPHGTGPLLEAVRRCLDT